ncbi:MAG: ferredoxin:glutaredoxin reductase [Euryarchaeota archaeon]|nr:ferredoxin:glutaredoxin reductase [Euryarchaeota archaeon]
MSAEPTNEEVERLRSKLDREAKAGGYSLSNDIDFVNDLVKGLIANERRYGYQACPCRLASGKKDEDLDMICPCDYRDPDLGEYGSCYCALYVTQEILDGKRMLESIPDRRPPPEERTAAMKDIAGKTISGKGGAMTDLRYPVWRCKVCGYLCARDEPPEVCPVCKAKKDRFERFI